MIVLPIVLGSAIAVPNTTEPTADDALMASAAIPATLQDEAAADPAVWHGYVNAGLSKTEGNANIQTYAVDARAQREVGVHRYTVEGLYYYAEDNDANESDPDEETLIQRRALLTGKYDQFVTEKTYFWANALGETNFASRIDLRWTVGAGIGHQWRDDDQWKINTEVGLAHFSEEFDSAPAGAKIRNSYAAIRAAWDVWTQLTETTSFGNFGEVFPSIEDKDDIYGRMTTYLEAQLSERMKARLSWLVVYDNTPTFDDDGESLKRADNLYLLTVGWTF